MDDPQTVIEGFKAAVLDVWLRDGQNTWPIDINAIAHLFMDLFVQDLDRDLERLNEKGYREPQIAALFKTPSRLVRLVMPCVLGMKAMGLAIEKQRHQVVYLLSLARHLKHGDLFNRDGKNIILSPEDFKRQVDQHKMIPADREGALAVHKLCAALWNYAECLCFRAHGLMRQFHGPYRFNGRDDEILIRDFICLRPLSLWPECQPVPYDSVRIAAAYRGLDMTVDIYDNVSIKEGTRYMDGIGGFYVEADGRLLDIDEVHRLHTVLSGVMVAITGKIESLRWRQLARKYAEIFWFSKKELQIGDELNQDWRCPPPVRQRIEEGNLSTKFQNITPRQLQLMLRIAL